jgi:hypothetical protein
MTSIIEKYDLSELEWCAGNMLHLRPRGRVRTLCNADPLYSPQSYILASRPRVSEEKAVGERKCKNCLKHLKSVEDQLPSNFGNEFIPGCLVSYSELWKELEPRVVVRQEEGGWIIRSLDFDVIAANTKLSLAIKQFIDRLKSYADFLDGTGATEDDMSIATSIYAIFERSRTSEVICNTLPSELSQDNYWKVKLEENQRETKKIVAQSLETKKRLTQALEDLQTTLAELRVLKGK